jgi:hypothetical protein
MTETAVQYLKRMVFPYLTHEQKLLTGQFFVESENMEKEQIIDAYNEGYSIRDYYGNRSDNTTAEQYYNETYGK